MANQSEKQIRKSGRYLLQISHLPTKLRSSELAHASRRASMELSTTKCPFSSMRNSAAPVTCPISCAPTLYCLALSSTRAREAGARETTARAARSQKRAASSGIPDLSVIWADNPSLLLPARSNDAKQDSPSATAKPPSLKSCAERIAPCVARERRQRCRFFSAIRSMGGGAPAVRSAMALTYSVEENPIATSVEEAFWSNAGEPSNKTNTSPTS